MSLKLSTRTMFVRTGTRLRPMLRRAIAINAKEGRRPHEDNMVEIRKNCKEKSLQKKHREDFHPSNRPLLSPPMLWRRREEKEVIGENYEVFLKSLVLFVSPSFSLRIAETRASRRST